MHLCRAPVPVRDIPRARVAGGRALSGEDPATAIIATLTVYCLRGASFGSLGGFAPSLIAVAVTVALHLWKRNTLISVVGGTACYMLLVQLVFA